MSRSQYLNKGLDFVKQTDIHNTLRGIETNTKNITLSADTVNLNTDGLETLATAGNASLTSINNKTVLPSALTGSGNLKVCIQELGNEGSERLNVDIGDSNVRLPTQLTGSGNLKVSIQESFGTHIATEAKQGAGLPSTLTSSGNLKVSIEEGSASGGDASAANQTTMISNLASIKSAVEGTLTVGSHAVTNAGTFAVQAACSGTVTANLSATDNAVLDAILAKNTEIETSADALIAANHTDLVALEASLTSMEGKIDTLDTVLDNCLVKHTNNETLLTAGNVDHAANEVLLTAIAADGDAIQTKLDTLETSANAIQSAVEGTLTVGSHAVTNAGTFAVQAACSGTVTANLSATDNAVLDAIAADGDAIQTKLDTLETSANAIQSAVEGTLTVGSHAVTNAGTFAVQAACSGTVTANLSATDNAVLDAINTSTSKILQGEGNITGGGSGLQQILCYGKDQSGNLDPINVDNNGHLKITINDIESGIANDLPISNAGLTELASAINSNRVDVNIANGGFDGVISGTVTANLSATDNAVLDAIAADGDAIQTKLDTLETSANAIQSAVEGTLTVGSHAVTNAGTFAVQAACSGTVTANLSATDNAVLDAIDAVLDTIKVDTEAIETAVEVLSANQTKSVTQLLYGTGNLVANGTPESSTNSVEMLNNSERVTIFIEAQNTSWDAFAEWSYDNSTWIQDQSLNFSGNQSIFYHDFKKGKYLRVKVNNQNGLAGDTNSFVVNIVQ